jgi:hypothetical protein
LRRTVTAFWSKSREPMALTLYLVAAAGRSHVGSCCMAARAASLPSRTRSNGQATKEPRSLDTRVKIRWEKNTS